MSLTAARPAAGSRRAAKRLAETLAVACERGFALAGNRHALAACRVASGERDPRALSSSESVFPSKIRIVSLEKLSDADSVRVYRFRR
jgi:hypothetical protein